MTVTRRAFLGSTAAAAGFTIVRPHVLGGPRHVAPSDTVNIALVGAGGQGRSNLRELFKLDDARVVAVADPAESWDLGSFYYKGDAGRKPVCAEITRHYAGKSLDVKPAEYADFREMLDKEKNLDAVLCATPDHLHAYVSIRTMKAGKAIYCEKPLTHNVAEARRVAEVARETKVATQMGNQLHATPGLRQTVEWLRAGVVGPIKEVHAWVGASRWNPTLRGKPTENETKPTGLNWDLWIGPREPRPFHHAYAPVAWRDFWAFGSGGLGDFGCHDLDSTVWALDLENPLRIEASPAGYTDADITPYGSIVHYRFPARGEQPPLALTWYDGGLRPALPDALPFGLTLPGRGALFVGEKGVLLSQTGATPRIFPAERASGFTPPAPSLPRSKGHHREWLDAIKGGPPAASNFAYGARLSEIALLGVLALRTGRTIDWDHVNLKARGFPDADAAIHETYRSGWELG
ncbi:MAG: Gfo/Idh/MocA family oxidoreductase [Isosphaeraceae bacterium]